MTCATERAKLDEATGAVDAAEAKLDDAYDAVSQALERVGARCSAARRSHKAADMAACAAAEAEAEAADQAFSSALTACAEAREAKAKAQGEYNSCVNNCPAWVWIVQDLFG